MARAVRTLDALLRFDRLYVGGGNSRRITVVLGPNAELSWDGNQLVVMPRPG